MFDGYFHLETVFYSAFMCRSLRRTRRRHVSRSSPGASCQHVVGGQGAANKTQRNLEQHMHSLAPHEIAYKIIATPPFALRPSHRTPIPSPIPSLSPSPSSASNSVPHHPLPLLLNLALSMHAAFSFLDSVSLSEACHARILQGN